jgi:hypothetical protein
MEDEGYQFHSERGIDSKRWDGIGDRREDEGD